MYDAMYDERYVWGNNTWYWKICMMQWYMILKDMYDEMIHDIERYVSVAYFK